MGISTHYYTIYGIKTNYSSEFSEGSYDDVYNDEDTPFVLIDGMSGEYMVFGKVLFDSGDLRWGDTKDCYVEIDQSSLPQIEVEYREAFVKKFPDFEHLIEGEFKLMTLVHYL